MVNITDSSWVSAESLAFELVKNYPETDEYFSVYYYTLYPDIYLSKPKFLLQENIVKEVFMISLESGGIMQGRESMFKRLNSLFSHIKELEKLTKCRDTFNLIKASIYLKDRKNFSKVRLICRNILRRHPYWFLNIYFLFSYAIKSGDKKEMENLADYVYKNRDKFELSCSDILSLLRILQWSDLSKFSLKTIKNLYDFAVYHLRNKQPESFMAWRCRQEEIYERWNYVIIREYNIKVSSLIKEGESEKAKELVDEVFEKFPYHREENLWFIYARFNKKDKKKLLDIYRRGLGCGVLKFYDSLMVLVEKMYNKEKAKEILYEEAFSNKSIYVLKRLKEWLKPIFDS